MLCRLNRNHFVSLLFALTLFTPSLLGQEAAATQEELLAQLPTIADEPKLVDPAQLMPEKLAAPATADFSDSSLGELVDWLRAEQGLVVLLEKSALAEINVFPGDSMSDRLVNSPVYLLLNRLRFHGLSWYFQDDILHITSPEVAQEHPTTVPYGVGDLLDGGYDADDLTTVITSTIAPDDWNEVGGIGVLSFLGDVMFVRQTEEIQRQVQGLLTALRRHGRQTFIFDPPQHAVLREKLVANLSVDFLDTPLETAAANLATLSQADIRLDVPALREQRIREREPVTLKLADRPLKTILQAMLMDLDLTWMLQDGVLWITTAERAEESLKTAVYDVRDLSRDQAESDALREAILSQTENSAWDEVGGPGSLHFARPGTLVVLNDEDVLMEVLDLLETYRTALRTSKPRDRHAPDPNEVITVYYRMHATIADDLVDALPKLVAPETWKSQTRPDASGEILQVASRPEVLDVAGQLGLDSGKGTSEQARMLVVSRAVLVISQTRAAHDEIAKVLSRIESGDTRSVDKGGGMGGFGGGFFSLRLPEGRPSKADSER
jgi:hypothetical protein